MILKIIWLVVWHIFYFPIQLGISSSQLTKSYFSGRGGPGPPASTAAEQGMDGNDPFHNHDPIPPATHPATLRDSRTDVSTGWAPPDMLVGL